MSTTPDPAPRDLTSSRGFSVGKWVVAVPLHLTLAFGLFAGCTSDLAPVDPVTESSPSPSAPTTSATPSPSAPTATPSPAVPSTPSPSPTETPVRPITPPSEAFIALEELRVAAAGTMSDYDRQAQFGEWIDSDGDCEDTRNEVLNRDLTNVTSNDGCTVATGTLADPYTGATINFTRGVATSNDVQIDHVVALGNAWVTGARNLSQTDRVAFANDPLNLLAVDGPTNGAKSDRDASQWLPPAVGFRCEFVAIQIAVKTQYNLWVTAPEKDAMASVLSDCPDQQLPTAAGFGDIPPPAPEPPAPEPPAPEPPAPEPPAPEPPAPLPPGEVYYPNCAAARAAGVAPLTKDEPGYRPGLDGDSDGIACDT